MTLPTPPRKQWFLDRIGTRVWRSALILEDGTKCKCPTCEMAFNTSRRIDSEEDALKLYNFELISQFTYFSTKEERDEHETRHHV